MKTYFVCSDIHGFFKEWMLSLKEAGCDIKNSDHVLIILGDIFDRGSEPWKVYKFIRSLPEERIILVKGNHEYLLLELVERRMYIQVLLLILSLMNSLNSGKVLSKKLVILIKYFVLSLMRSKCLLHKERNARVW